MQNNTLTIAKDATEYDNERSPKQIKQTFKELLFMKITNLLLVLLFFSIQVFSQPFADQVDINNAIDAARSDMESQKKDSGDKSENYIKAATKLAILLSKRSLPDEQPKNNMPLFVEGEDKKERSQRSDDLDESIKLLTKALEYYEKNGNKPTLELADIKFTLARLITTDFQAISNETRTFLTTNEAEKFYTDALDIRAINLGRAHDTTLNTLSEFANFCVIWARFEKALYLYENYISLVEKKYGAESNLLIPALQRYAAALVSVDMNSEAEQIMGKLSKLTGKSEVLPEPDQDIAIRSKGYASEKDLDIAKSVRVGQRTGIKLMLRAKFFKESYKVFIVVKENGTVESAKAINGRQEKNFKSIEERVSKWKFYPVSYKGTSHKMKGFVHVE